PRRGLPQAHLALHRRRRRADRRRHRPTRHAPHPHPRAGDGPHQARRSPVAEARRHAGLADVTGTVAITDEGWYRFLYEHPELREVNFWRPSARASFNAPEFSPFFFKLRARHNNAICGFAFFAHFSRLPDWLAWDIRVLRTCGRASGTTKPLAR